MKHLLYFILYIILHIYCFSLSYSQIHNLDSTVAQLSLKSEKMMNYAKDYSDYLDNIKSTEAEYESVGEMYHEAMTTADYLYATTICLRIYSDISSKVDRKSTKLILNDLLNHYIRQLELAISNINHEILSIKHPGIAESINRFKEDLRDIISEFNRILNWPPHNK